MKTENFKCLLIIGLLLILASCVTHRDYVFDVSGVVLNKEGKPLSDVSVSIEISREVYDGITPLVKADRLTNDKGEFKFSYIAPVPDITYTIKLHKPGYQELSIKNSSKNLEPFRIELIPTQ